MLRIIPEENQIIFPEWIHYYDEIPEISYLEKGYRFSAIGIDLAISEKASADYTAMICARVFGHKDDLRIFILPHPVNARLDFPSTVTKAKELSAVLQGNQTKIFIEKVGYQQALVDQLIEEGYRNAEGVGVHGEDKRGRLTLTTDFIHTGKVLFPKHGAEGLIQQLIRFGVERYDDLTDAFSILILKIIDISAQVSHVSFAPVEIPEYNPNQPLSDYFKHSINWNNPVERARFDKEADLQIIQEELQKARNGWFR